MLLFLFDFLREYLGWKVPSVFEYCSTRMALSAISSLLLTIICGKFFIKKLYEMKVGERIRTEHCPLLGELHRNKADTPTMGGILILFSILASLLLWMNLQSPFTLILFATTIIAGSLGGYDDYYKLRYKSKKGLAAKKKLLIQGLLGAGVALYLLWPAFAESLHAKKWFIPPHAKEVVSHGDKPIDLTARDYAARLYVPFVKTPVWQAKTALALLGMVILIAFVITGASNAVNLTDGLDGLATGTVMLASLAFALIAFVSNNLDLSSYLNILYIEGSSEIAIYLAAVAGATLGFLWYNGYPAQVFMGDTGSLTLGAILGVSAVLLKRELLLGIIGGVFVIEALSVILQVGSYKLRNKKRIFLIAPLHHHFEYKGWHETKVVVRFWILSLLLAMVGIASLKFQ